MVSAGQVGQFVDMRGLALAGDGWAQLDWKRSPDKEFHTNGKLELRAFQLAAADRRRWTEESLLATLALSGRTDFTADSRLDNAVLEVTAGSDQSDRLDRRTG